MITIEVEERIEAEAGAVLNRLGISIPEALRQTLASIAREGHFPVESVVKEARIQAALKAAREEAVAMPAQLRSVLEKAGMKTEDTDDEEYASFRRLLIHWTDPPEGVTVTEWAQLLKKDQFPEQFNSSQLSQEEEIKSWSTYPAIGMWADREDMADPNAWRQARREKRRQRLECSRAD